MDKVILIEEILGEFGFTIRWAYSSHWTDVAVFEKVGTEMSEPPRALYHRKDWSDSSDTVYHIDEAEPYLEGFVKWDGCTELDMGRPHWCGLECYRKHCDLLQYIYIRSQQIMSAADRELFGGPWSPPSATGDGE